ncbi:MAG: DUF2378 family protein [Myxococcaceae bacterium]
MGAEEPVVFGSSYEALERVLGDQLDESVRAKLRGFGVDLKKLNPAYPYRTWLHSLELTMALKWPGVAREEASYHLGRAIFESFGQTLMGKALMPLLRVLGPRRGLERMNRNLRSSNNYSRTTLEQRAPTSFALGINLVAYPQYFRGLLEDGLENSGAKSPKVEVLSHVSDDATTRQLGEIPAGLVIGPAQFLVSWTA